MLMWSVFIVFIIFRWWKSVFKMAERLFEKNYNSPVYGFENVEARRKLK